MVWVLHDGETNESGGPVNAGIWIAPKPCRVGILSPTMGKWFQDCTAEDKDPKGAESASLSLASLAPLFP